MAKRIQFRRGTTAQTAIFTGAPGEITVDTDKNVVVVHDGITPGGFPANTSTNPTFNGTVTINGLERVTNTTQSSSVTTGALTVAGGVGIGAQLYVGGNINTAATTASTSVTTGAIVVAGGVGIAGRLTVGNIVETSSIAFKENVNPLSNALDSILQLSGVMYDRKDKSAKNEAGLIAEEVDKVLPNLVTKDENGNPYGVHYTKLVAYLVEAIKDQQRQIDELKKDR